MSEKKRNRGRPASFNKQLLLETVMQIFWDRGYKDVSFNEIAQRTGLTRASLYNAFETKEALFIETLQYYFERSPDSLLYSIDNGDLVGPVLFRIFKKAAKLYTSNEQRRGCFGVNSMNELMADPTELGKHIKGMYESYKLLLKACIRQAIEQRELPESTNPESTAQIIFIFMNGFSVLSKSETTEKTLCVLAHDFLNTHWL